MNKDLLFTLEDLEIPLYAMGFTARDQEQMKKNLKALDKMGISYPKEFPQLYPCQKYLLTPKSEIEVVSENTCGEVEYIILKKSEEYFIGVGSDHADKVVEKNSIINSKQLCAKHYSKEFWRLEDVIDHWDDIIIRSYQKEVNGKDKLLYQEGHLYQILSVKDTIQFVEKKLKNKEEYIVFGGSIASHLDVIYGEEFYYEMEDPQLSRKIKSSYKINNICKEII